MHAERPTEEGKRKRIAKAVEVGGHLAADYGASVEDSATFLTHYFRHVDPIDVVEREPEELARIVASHVELASQRNSASANVNVFAPSRRDGWDTDAAVIQIVSDDRPFLVDTVSLELDRLGWYVREIFHPQVVVRRDITGKLVGIVHTHDADLSDAVRESWMHIEADPPLTDFRSAARELTDGLHTVLEMNEEAVEDWSKMRQRALETIDLIRSQELPHPDHEVQATVELLDWMADDHFTFLGYREYTLHGSGEGQSYEAVPGTGLGILRADQDEPNTFHALPPTQELPAVVTITKDNQKSRVHRPSYLDYIGVRLFDNGKVIGERRFLGLFSASAYTDSVMWIPVLRAKTEEILKRSGYAPDSHGAKAIQAAIESFPRDELFQTKARVLAPVVEMISRLKDRRQVRVFVRRDAYGRYVSFLVFLPRDRYNTRVRLRMEEILRLWLGGESVEFEARVSESKLARLHFVVRMPAGEPIGVVDVPGLERELTQATRNWDDDLADEMAISDEDLSMLARYADGLPEGYKEEFSARHAVMDLAELSRLRTPEDMSMVLYASDNAADPADLRLKVFRRDAEMPLSEVLPHLALLGVKVTDERPYEIDLSGAKGMIYDFGLQIPGGREALGSWTEPDRNRFAKAFEASWQGKAEVDPLNGLVMSAGLPWERITWLRCISRYLQQAGATYSQSYIAETLLANDTLAAQLTDLFRTKFDPALFTDEASRAEAVEHLRTLISDGIEQVRSLDHDRILRSFLSVIDAAVRTNAFRPDKKALAIKLLPREMAEVPEPKPAYEVFIYSPQIEGVHLRFGKVARGGVRWSDRREDFRTEVLGLVKAQMVKNAVIVPIGAAGCFYPKRLPDQATDRVGWLEEGKKTYRIFIHSLLDLTDNMVGGEVSPPRHVLRYDDDDPYLVVAADRGTAQFSDLANEISLHRGFWLGDAFASGGSFGYDHKAMAITARGAWVSAQHHFREMGIDPEHDEFTCVGIGDMGGDVFGNGMLRSQTMKLVAAFDHDYIFIDPQPDAARSFVERRRLQAMPRSSWADYDRTVISSGGGVWERSVKAIPINDGVREALGLADGVKSLTPNEVVRAILKAPVDLLWNGGVGTYVKGRAETNAQVADKANDPVRVNGDELRARSIVEGGNLGCTQLGRIDFAKGGGRINCDFIDNSAGVDTSDHEVNIKILLANEVTAGRLDLDERNRLLEQMTDEVAAHVLGHNYDQNLALANGAAMAAGMAGVHERWMARLEKAGLLDRRLESMPSTAEMERRIRKGEGLTSPELGVLLAYTKIFLEHEVLASELPDDPYLADRLVQYFPKPLRNRFQGHMQQHRLKREIITNVAVNRYVNSAGITGYYRMAEEVHASVSDIIRSQLAARAIFKVGYFETLTYRLDNQVDTGVQTKMRLDLRHVVERASRWLLSNRRMTMPVQDVVDEFGAEVLQVAENFRDCLTGRGLDRYDGRREAYIEAGAPAELADVVAAVGQLFQAMAIVENAHRSGRDLLVVAKTHFAMADLLGLDRLAHQISTLSRQDRWDAMARASLRDDLVALQGQLVAEALVSVPDQQDAAKIVGQWSKATAGFERAQRLIEQVCSGEPEIARLSVGLRAGRALLHG